MLRHKTTHWMHELGDALTAARETYRAYSADGERDAPPAPAAPELPPEAHVPAVARRSREVARRLSGRTRAVLAPREEPDVYLDVPELKVD
jgi:hypothetical protein